MMVTYEKMDGHSGLKYASFLRSYTVVYYAVEVNAISGQIGVV